LLYWLLYLKLFHYFPPFRIFRYLTFRTAFASLTALFTGLIVGPIVIRRLRDFQIGQYIREEGPQAHQKKAGTPTMGGIMVIVPVLLLTILLNAVALIGFTQSGIGRSVLIPMIVMVGYAILGMIDDWEGIRGKRKGEGMRARTKFLFQVILGIGTALVLKYLLGICFVQNIAFLTTDANALTAHLDLLFTFFTGDVKHRHIFDAQCHLQHQSRFPDAGFSTNQNKGTGNNAATKNTVQFIVS